MLIGNHKESVYTQIIIENFLIICESISMWYINKMMLCYSLYYIIIQNILYSNIQNTFYSFWHADIKLQIDFIYLLNSKFSYVFCKIKIK